MLVPVLFFAVLVVLLGLGGLRVKARRLVA